MPFAIHRASSSSRLDGIGATSPLPPLKHAILPPLASFAPARQRHESVSLRARLALGPLHYVMASQTQLVAFGSAACNTPKDQRDRFIFGGRPRDFVNITSCLLSHNMSTTKMRVDRRPHPDLPWDPDTVYKHKYASSRSSWRPSWMTRSSTSSNSRSSSASTSRSDSVASRPASATNVYQLPNAYDGQAKEPDGAPTGESPIVPEMRIEFMDETFDFPLPVAKTFPGPRRTSSMGWSAKSTEPDLSECDSRGRHIPPSSHTGSHSSAGRGSIASRTPTDTSRGPVASAKRAEIEMASEEHFGYWNASFAVRIPPAAALCGSFLLCVRLWQHDVAGHGISLDAEVAKISDALAKASRPAQLLGQLQSLSTASAIVMLKTSLEAAQTPGIPLKVAEKLLKMKTETAKKGRRLWPAIVKQLKKMPQDRLVLLMFLVSIARRLKRAGVTIDGNEPAGFLLQNIWPMGVVVPDLSRLLVDHFDEIPASSTIICRDSVGDGEALAADIALSGMKVLEVAKRDTVVRLNCTATTATFNDVDACTLLLT
ncbi:hypothetical protein BST61_g5258 [Cercospora zeina]